MLTDNKGALYAVSKEGKVFRYDYTYDIFKLEYRMPTILNDHEKVSEVNFSFINTDNSIWICANNLIFIWNPFTKQSNIINNHIDGTISHITPLNENQFFVGSGSDVHFASLNNDSLCSVTYKNLKVENQDIPINTIHYDKANEKLVIGTPGYGLCILRDRKSTR